jgi:hypothetical protein
LRFAGKFDRACPIAGVLTEANGVMYRVRYSGSRAAWDEPEVTEEEEIPNPIIPAGRLDVCAALVDESVSGPQSMDHVQDSMYSHIRDVTAPLVFCTKP